jgi:hypothetical protein
VFDFETDAWAEKITQRIVARDEELASRIAARSAR